MTRVVYPVGPVAAGLAQGRLVVLVVARRPPRRRSPAARAAGALRGWFGRVWR